MNRSLAIYALIAALALVMIPADVLAGRGGGRGGGGGGGGGRGDAGGGNRGGGGMPGGENRGGGGMQGGAGSAGHSPAFSQPPRSTNTANTRPQNGEQPQQAARPSTNSANRNPFANTNNPGAANRNPTNPSNAGAAAAGAGYANRNPQQYSNAGAAAAGAGAANRNQQDQYHRGMTNGYWNNNYGVVGVGAATLGGVAAWGVGSPMYGYGYSGYSNPYSSGMTGAVGTQVQQSALQAYDYSQPISTVAVAPEPTTANDANSVFDQARSAFSANNYPTAIQLDQQALTQTPNDATLHEFLALAYFAQGKYDQAAGPLYAVLSVGPGWDWTTLIGNYSDANLYTTQVRALEAYVKANPKSAQARFVLAYHYITQTHSDAAAAQLKQVVALQPNDTLSAQLLAKLQPAAGSAVAPTPSPAPLPPFDASKLTGNWAAVSPQNAKIAMAIKADGSFTWSVAQQGKPPISIAGASSLADGVLTLDDQNTQMGALSGLIAWKDDSHFQFKATGAAVDDPGLNFAR